MRKMILSLLLAAGVLPAWAQTPLDTAVAAYQRGDLTQARSAFLRLSAQGVPAADYNLAVMHLRGEMPARFYTIPEAG